MSSLSHLTSLFVEGNHQAAVKIPEVSQSKTCRSSSWSSASNRCSTISRWEPVLSHCNLAVEDKTDPGHVHNTDLETSKRLYGTRDDFCLSCLDVILKR